MWNLQDQITQLLPNGRHAVVEANGHDIHKEQPEPVIHRRRAGRGHPFDVAQGRIWTGTTPRRHAYLAWRGAGIITTGDLVRERDDPAQEG